MIAYEFNSIIIVFGVLFTLFITNLLFVSDGSTIYNSAKKICIEKGFNDYVDY